MFLWESIVFRAFGILFSQGFSGSTALQRSLQSLRYMFQVFLSCYAGNVHFYLGNVIAFLS